MTCTQEQIIEFAATKVAPFWSNIIRKCDYRLNINEDTMKVYSSKIARKSSLAEFNSGGEEFSYDYRAKFTNEAGPIDHTIICTERKAEYTQKNKTMTVYMRVNGYGNFSITIAVRVHE